MELATLDVVTKNRLAAEYRDSGVVVVPGVDLPPVFVPRAADFAFVAVDGGCEVHIAAQPAYQGSDPQWRQAMAAPATPARTRKITTTRGDFFSGLGKAVQMLQTAAAEPAPAAAAAPVEEVDAPLEEAGHERQQARPENRRRPGRAPALRDLVAEARNQERRSVGREDVLAALKTNLIRQTKPGVVLIGRPGVGKTTVVEMLAADVAADHDVPAALRNKAIYDLPLGSLVEGGRYIGDIERQARQILERPGQPIFFVDEVHQLARPELRPLCDVLKPGLAAGHIRVIGATTTTDWRALQDNAFKRRFLEITVEEPSPADTFLMLQERAKVLAQHHGIEIPDDMLREAIMLAARYMPAKSFPDKAIDVLDQAAAMQVTKPGQGENRHDAA